MSVTRIAFLFLFMIRAIVNAPCQTSCLEEAMSYVAMDVKGDPTSAFMLSAVEGVSSAPTARLRVGYSMGTLHENSVIVTNPDDVFTSRSLDMINSLKAVPSFESKKLFNSLPCTLADDSFWQNAILMALLEYHISSDTLYFEFKPGMSAIAVKTTGSKKGVLVEELCRTSKGAYEFSVIRIYEAQLSFSTYLLRRPLGNPASNVDAIWDVAQG